MVGICQIMLIYPSCLGQGAFYMDDETLAKEESDVRKRNFAEPTLEDK